MQKAKKWIAGVLTLAMVGSSLVTAPEMQAKKKTKGFTISKVAGTYTGKVTVKVKAKKRLHGLLHHGEKVINR